MLRVTGLITLLLTGCASSGAVLDGYSTDEQARLESWTESAGRMARRSRMDRVEQRELQREASDERLTPAERAQALRRLGFNFHGRQEGEWLRAAAILEQALVLAPDDPKVLEDAGRALILVGERERGIALLHRAETDAAASFLEILDG